MTAGYALLLPSMWVCALAYVLSHGWTLFREQVPARIDSPAHRGDFIVDILEGLTVRNAYDTLASTSFTKAPLDMPLREMAKLITHSRQTSFPVVDAGDKYYGMFWLNDIRQFLYDSGELADLAVAQDLARPCEPLYTNMNLSDAISRFAEEKFHELPVVESDRPDVVVGLLRQEDLIATYNARLLQARKEKAEAQDRP
jgi:CIC family chloride channel protein